MNWSASDVSSSQAAIAGKAALPLILQRRNTGQDGPRIASYAHYQSPVDHGPRRYRSAGLRVFLLTCRVTRRAAEIVAWTFGAAGSSCGPGTWAAAAASTATRWAWPSTGSSAPGRSRGGVLPWPGLARGLWAPGRPCRALGDALGSARDAPAGHPRAFRGRVPSSGTPQSSPWA